MPRHIRVVPLKDLHSLGDKRIAAILAGHAFQTNRKSPAVFRLQTCQIDGRKTSLVVLVAPVALAKMCFAGHAARLIGPLFFCEVADL